jgi:hypothetical protein
MQSIHCGNLIKHMLALNSIGQQAILAFMSPYEQIGGGHLEKNTHPILEDFTVGPNCQTAGAVLHPFGCTQLLWPVYSGPGVVYAPPLQHLVHRCALHRSGGD